MRVPANKISLPIPNLDDKTFDELFEEARALIPRYAPKWTNHNFSDPGITLIDLFAWLTEMEIYTLNRINDRNILKFLKLMGEAPKASKSATVNLEFSIGDNPTGSVVLKKGTQAVAVDASSNEQLVFETDADLTVGNLKIAHLFSNDLERFAQQTNNNTTNSSHYFAFGNKALAKSEFYIAFSADQEFPDSEISLLINTYQADLPAHETGNEPLNIIPSAKLEWQFKGESTTWQPLEVKEDATAALTQNGRIRFQGSDQFKKAKIKDIIPSILNSTDPSFYWIRAVVKEAGYEIPPRIDAIFVNAVTATQARTIVDELISQERMTRQGLPYQTVSLQYKPVLAKTLILEVSEEDKTWHQWQEVFDFDASKPTDRHYIVDLKEGEVQFGDGINGRIPPEMEMMVGSSILADHYKATYKAGGGINGNVKADSIRSLLTPDINAKLNNPRPATGGTDVESLDAAQHRIRRDLRQPYRTVQNDDFEKLAKQTPWLRLQRVKVLPLYHPNYPNINMPGSVTVVIVPYVLSNSVDTTIPKPSSGFLQTVANFLEPRCLLATRLHVIAPEFIKIHIEITLEVAPRKNTELLKIEIKNALRKFLNPNNNELENYPGWPFGRAVYKSEIYKIAQEVEGVICVKKVTLSTDNCLAKVNGNISIPKIGLVYLGDCKILVSEGSGR